MSNGFFFVVLVKLHSISQCLDHLSNIIMFSSKYFFSTYSKEKKALCNFSSHLSLFRCWCVRLVLERSPCVNPKQDNHQMTAAVLTWPTVWKIHSPGCCWDSLTVIQEEHPGENLLARPLHMLARQQAVAPHPTKQSTSQRIWKNTWYSLRTKGLVKQHQ